MEIQVSLSALAPSQYRPYLKNWTPNKALLKIFERISGKTGRKAMRIYFDIGHNVIKNADVLSTAPQPINDFLAEKKITVLDYFAGIGRDSHGRTVRLGKALAKEAELKKMFDSDPNRKVVAQEGKSGRMVCLSMHPYDIAGMSTDRGWVSCMNLVNGTNKHYIKSEVKTGTLIAYLIDANDKNINKPVARCLLKPFFDVDAVRPSVGKKGVTVVYLADRAYPDKNATFVMQVQDWVDQNINKDLAAGKTTLSLALPDKLYDDMQRGMFKYDASKTAAENNEASYAELRMRQEVRNDPDGYLSKITATEYTDRLGNNIANMSKEFFSFVRKVLASGWGGDDLLSKVTKAVAHMEAFESPSVYSQIKKAYLDYASNNLSDSQLLEQAELVGFNPGLAIPLLGFVESEDESMTDRVTQSLDTIALYSKKDGSEGGYPDALREIWDKAKYFSDSDGVFWRQASYVGFNGGTVESVLEDMNSRYSKENLVAALVSLYFAVRDKDKIEALTAKSLKACDDVVRPDYTEYALPIFDGLTPIKIHLGMRLTNRIVADTHGFDKKTFRKVNANRFQMEKGITASDVINSNVIADVGLTFVDKIADSSGFVAFYVKDQLDAEAYSAAINAIEKAIVLNYLDHATN
ncbi:hypothetical protein [Erwinia phage vB_Ea_2910A]|nr:hypothetical protein [Erwinia phage vB_Ea_2910A]